MHRSLRASCPSISKSYHWLTGQHGNGTVFLFCQRATIVGQTAKFLHLGNICWWCHGVANSSDASKSDELAASSRFLANAALPPERLHELHPHPTPPSTYSPSPPMPPSLSLRRSAPCSPWEIVTEKTQRMAPYGAFRLQRKGVGF